MRTAITAIALTTWMLSGSLAAAQSLTLSVTRIKGPGGDRATEVVKNGANSLDCAEPTATEITVMASNPMTKGFDLWVSTSGDCAIDENRTSTTNRLCYNIGQLDILDANNTFTVTLAEVTTGEVDPCATTTRSGATFRLYALDTGTNNTSTLGSDPYGYVEIQVDPNPPNAPELTTGDAAGQTSVKVGWTAPAEGDSTRLTYNIYGAAAGAGCADASAEPELLTEQLSGSSYGVNPSAAGLAVGESILVTVHAVDPAGNEGEPSDAVCITMQPTAGFCDVYAASGGQCPSGGCALAPGPQRGAPGLALFALAALMVARARRARKDPA